MHPVINDIQYISCVPHVNEQAIIEAVKRNDSEAFVTKMVDRSVASLFSGLIDVVSIIRWCDPILVNAHLLPLPDDESASEGEIAEQTRIDLIRMFSSEVSVLLDHRIPEFWLAFSHALNGKQRRELKTLCLELEVIQHEVKTVITSRQRNISLGPGFGRIPFEMFSVEIADWAIEVLDLMWPKFIEKLVSLYAEVELHSPYRDKLNNLSSQIAKHRSIEDIQRYLAATSKMNKYISVEKLEEDINDIINECALTAVSLVEQGQVTDLLKKI